MVVLRPYGLALTGPPAVLSIPVAPAPPGAPAADPARLRLCRLDEVRGEGGEGGAEGGGRGEGGSEGGEERRERQRERER